MNKRQSGHAMRIPVTPDDVRAIVQAIVAGRPDDSGLLGVHAAAHCIFLEALGVDWYKRVLGHGAPNGTYFRSNADHGDRTRVLGQARALLVAEAIFNLQGVPGFSDRLEQMKGRCDLAGMCAELAWPGFFRRKGVPVEFRRDEQDQKNPDLVVRTPFGPLLAEVKGRPDIGAKPTTIFRLLRDAREQLGPALANEGGFIGGVALVWLPASVGNEPTETLDQALEAAHRDIFAEPGPPDNFGVMREVLALDPASQDIKFAVAYQPVFRNRPQRDDADAITAYLSRALLDAPDWPHWVYLASLVPNQTGVRELGQQDSARLLAMEWPDPGELAEVGRR